MDSLIDQTLGACKRAIRDAGLKKNEIDEVVWWGLDENAPVGEKVSELFGLHQNVPLIQIW